MKDRERDVWIASSVSSVSESAENYAYLSGISCGLAKLSSLEPRMLFGILWLFGRDFGKKADLFHGADKLGKLPQACFVLKSQAEPRAT